jgi:hypothetical protein
MIMTFTTIIDVYDQLYEVKLGFNDRIEFYYEEYTKLVVQYNNGYINDSVFMKKFCPLNIEKANINDEYKSQINTLIKTIPKDYLFQDILDYFDIELL